MSEEGRETFGRRLKRLREAAGLSQAQLAAAACVPVGTLRNAEYDRREPLVSTAGKLAAAIGVTVDELLGLPIRPSPAGQERSARDRAGGAAKGEEEAGPAKKRRRPGKGG
jgi:transcriptional regulator with XRE-family HTH domain